MGGLASLLSSLISSTGNSGSDFKIEPNQVSDNKPLANTEAEQPEMEQPETEQPQSDNSKQEMLSNGVSSLLNATENSGSNQTIQPQQVAYNQPISSDENGKCDIRKEMDGKDPIDIFAQIDAYLYKYKPEFQKEYAGTGMTNNEDNFGVMAQDLQANPITRAAVKEDGKGHLALDGGRLSSINTAMISELCKRIEDLESAVYGR